LLTRADDRPGTGGYIAPERMAGERGQVASDLWSLGIVLLELLGALPAEARVVLPAELSDLLDRLTAGQPSRRPHSAGEVAHTLRELEKRTWPNTVAPVAPKTAAFTPTSAA
jgi:serine/threonine protein kinase